MMVDPSIKPAEVARVNTVRYLDKQGHTLLEVIGETVEVARMTHDRSATTRLFLALMDHLSSAGGPLEFCEGEILAIRREAIAHLELPF